MISRSMFSFAVWWGVTSSLLFAQQQYKAHPQRDTQVIEILNRVVQVGGGARALASVHGITESGEIIFYWRENVKGPVTLAILGGNHFRMEADLPQEKTTWIVKDGVGSKKESGKVTPISRENALNLGNLTYPLGHVVAALADPATDISFVNIEKQEGRSIYRFRVKGRLGLVADGSPASVTKDLIIDALTFDILSVEDHPYPTYKSPGKPSDTAPREVEFGNFRTVDGIRMPFSITTKLQGQRTLSIRLSEVSFNNNLSLNDFLVQK